MGKQYEQSHIATAAKTGPGRRTIEARLPKIIEDPKALLALKGHATSAIGTALLNDICLLKKPLCKKLLRKNDLLPFEAGGESHLENLTRLNDCSLFALVNHTKKRPHNIIFGRTFGFRILDMVEFGIINYVPMASFPHLKSASGSKPLLIFNGDDYEASENTRSICSILLDIFRGPDDVKALNLAGVDRVIVFTLKGDSKVLFRQYAIELRKADDSTLPRVALKEAGPHFDLEVRRVHTAPEGLMREAMKRPKDPRAVRKTKNVSRDEMGDKKGRVHVGKQDLSELVLARMKGLNKKRGSIDAEQVVKEGSNGDSPDELEEHDMDITPTEKRQKVSSS